MTLKRKVLINTAVSMTLLFSGLIFLAYNQARSVELARDVYAQPAQTHAGAIAELEGRKRVAWRVALGLIAFVLIERSLVIFGSLLPFASSVQDLRQRTRRIAAGDLRGREQSLKNNEIGQVLGSFDEMKAELAATVREVARTAQAVEDAAHALRTCNQDLSRRTEQQAASLQQTAASVREFSGATKHNAIRAEQARTFTQNARATAQQGGQVVASAIASMGEISQGSHRMDEIITVIDAIAFQTNVLALNAAVEAARAGAQGRGFGVVAAEVRSLAQRSAAAAKEVRELIARSREQVDAGVALVEKADGDIGSVMHAVLGTHEQVCEIANACAAQARAVEQIDATVEQLQSVTAQNSVLVQQGAEIAQSLSARAQQLVHLMQRFQLEEHAERALPQHALIEHTGRSIML